MYSNQLLDVMEVTEDLKNLMKAVRDDIISAIKPEIDKLTETVIPKLKQSIDANTSRIVTIEEDINDIKSKTDAATDNIDYVKDTSASNAAWIDNIEKDKNYIDKRFADISADIDKCFHTPKVMILNDLSQSRMPLTISSIKLLRRWMRR